MSRRALGSAFPQRKLLDPVKGKWWLPGQARRARQGELTQLPDESFELILEKAWPMADMVALFNRPEHLTLLGRTAVNRAVTLGSCLLMSFNLPRGAPARFSVHQVFLDAHWPKEGESLVREVQVRIPALDHWLDISGFRVDPPSSEPRVSVHFSQPEPVELELEPGLKLVFSFGWDGPTLQRPQLAVRMHQEAWLALRTSRPRRLRDLQKTLGRLLNLFGLWINNPLDYGELLAKTTDHQRTGQKAPMPVRVLHRPIAPEFVDAMVLSHEMLIRFQDVQADLAHRFHLWLEAYELCQPAFDLYFALQKRDPGYQEERFMMLVQALESFHRRRNARLPTPEHEERIGRILGCLDKKDKKWLKGRLKHSHELTLEDRLKYLVMPFDELFGSSSLVANFASNVANTRNYLTHYDPEMKARALDSGRLLPFIMRLRVLFILQCLIVVGFSPAEALQLIERNHRLHKEARVGPI